MRNVLGFLFVSSLLFVPNALGSPNFLTYQGRIIKSDGTPLVHSNVSFIFEITSEDGSCVIYREQRNGINMVNSNGLFDVDIGSGTRTVPDPGTSPTYKLSDAFVNGVTHNCAGSGTWAATVSAYRKLKVQFHDGTGWQVISPDNTIRSVPFAMTAKSATQLGDKTINDFVLKSNAPGSACTAGQVVFWDGTNFSCVTDAGGAGVISDVLAGTGIAVSGTTSKTVAVNFGTTAGTVAQGNDARITNALQSTTVFAGDVSGTATSMAVDRIKGVSIDSTAPTTGQVLRYDGAKWAAATPNAGTVTSVGVSVPSIMSASGGPITSSGTIAISLASQTGNTVFAAPNGSNGTPTFRTLGIADIFSSIGGLSFFNNSPSCAAGTALTYISATDRIQCASLAVDTANIANNAITSAKIADGAVTASKLGSDVGAWSTSGGHVYRTTGNVGIGTSTPTEALEVTSETNWATLASITYNSTMSPAMVGYRYRGTKASPAIVASGDYVFSNQGWGYDGANLRKVASIEFVVDGAPGTNDMPGVILFNTTDDGTINTTEKMRLTNAGRLGIGTAAPLASLDLSAKTDAIYFPKGTTAQQPAVPAAGMIRYNTDNNAAEFYNGSSWVNLAAITSGGTMTNVSTITGGVSGVNISAGGTNQNVTLTASGTGTVTTGSVMTVTNSTASTAYNNGALVVSGGVGVSGNINSNGNMYAAGSLAAGTSLYSPLIYGSTTASGTLTLDSTSNSTKGNILIAPNGGNVGLGTTSPTTIFTIDTAGTGYTKHYLTNRASSTGNTWNDIPGVVLIKNHSNDSSVKSPTVASEVIGEYVFGSVNASLSELNVAGISAVQVGNAASGAPNGASLHFKTADGLGGGLNTKMILTNAGNLGVGTSSPSSLLEIAGSNSTADLRLTRTNNVGASSEMGTINFFAPNASGTSMAWAQQRVVVEDGTAGSEKASLAFNTRGSGTVSEKMRITGAGNVGIGTASPAAKLEVNGAIKQGNYIQNNYSFFAGSSWQTGVNKRYLRIDTNIPWADGPYLNLFIRGMHYDAMKSIDLQISWYMFSSGIFGPHVTSKGTSTPEVSLANESGKISILLDVGASDRWYWSSLKFDVQFENLSDPSILNGWSAVESSFTGAATNIVGPLTPNNGTMVFGSKVGIGTYAPTSLLHIKRDTATSANFPANMQLIVEGTGNGGISVAGSSSATNGVYFSNPSNAYDGGLEYSNTSRVLSLRSAGANAVNIVSSGNVGIGVTSPSYLFHVKSASASTTSLFESTTALSVIGFIDSSTTVRPQIGSSGNNLFIQTNGSERVRIDASGSVGIGTISPAYKLDVSGDINASGSVRAAGVALSSDARFKRNIASINNPLGKVLALRGVEYDWKTEQYPERKFNNRHQIGVIAQEVEKVFPEVVDTDKQGFKSVNYPALVAPVISAIKELYNKLVGVDARVAELERENALLKAQNQELKKDVDQIKKSLGVK